MKVISLSRGMVTVVDDEDYDYLMRWAWHAMRSDERFYASGSECYPDGTIEHFLMHRLLLRASPGEFVDHRNGDTLDNRRENLRFCSLAQNLMNARKHKDCLSKFKGVCTTAHGRWRATIQFNRKFIWLGSYATPIEAARAYDAAARKYFGEFPKTNADLGLIKP